MLTTISGLELPCFSLLSKGLLIIVTVFGLTVFPIVLPIFVCYTGITFCIPVRTVVCYSVFMLAEDAVPLPVLVLP